MARTATKIAPAAEVVTDADLPGLPAATAAANQLAVMHSKQEAAAQAIATEIGYEGSLTIGALEDEIRFYQRRTVSSRSAWSSSASATGQPRALCRPLPKRRNLPIWHF